MSGSNRRSALGLALAAAIMPALTSRGAFATQVPQRLIAPPAGTMRFRRVLTREMVNGERILVARDFEVEFRHFADGFIVEGRQIAADVEAPAALSAFAELEEAREETGLFPLALDPFGRILSDDHPVPPGGEIERALAIAMRQISAQPIPADERSELQQFLGVLGTTGQGLIAHQPLDLFAPGEEPRREERTIALPSGDRGRVVTAFRGARDPVTGLMREATREVVTLLDGSRRSSRERWDLAPRQPA